MKSPPLLQIQTFLAVARHKSFSGAARELGVSRSAASQAVRQLEEQLGVVLLARTTRSVALTDAGRRLLESAAPGFGQILTALKEASAEPGQAVGRLRLSVPTAAIPLMLEAIVPAFREAHPRVELEIAVQDHFVDIVAGGFDAGVRLSEAIERDMVQVRLTPAFRFVVVGAPKYLAKHGTPERPEDLLRHECITFRSQTTGALYAWELERGRRSWRVPVHGALVVNDNGFRTSLATKGLGLHYALEPLVREQLRTGRLRIVLDRYAPMVPGFFLYFPTKARGLTPLRLFIDTAKAVTARGL